MLPGPFLMLSVILGFLLMGPLAMLFGYMHWPVVSWLGAGTRFVHNRMARALRNFVCGNLGSDSWVKVVTVETMIYSRMPPPCEPRPNPSLQRTHRKRCAAELKR